MKRHITGLHYEINIWWPQAAYVCLHATFGWSTIDWKYLKDGINGISNSKPGKWHITWVNVNKIILRRYLASGGLRYQKWPTFIIEYEPSVQMWVISERPPPPLLHQLKCPLYSVCQCVIKHSIILAGLFWIWLYYFSITGDSKKNKTIVVPQKCCPKGRHKKNGDIPQNRRHPPPQ